MSQSDEKDDEGYKPINPTPRIIFFLFVHPLLKSTEDKHDEKDDAGAKAAVRLTFRGLDVHI